MNDTNSIPIPNFTQIPNVICDYWMPRLKPTSFSVLICLCRKIFGWHKSTDSISRNQLMKCTGLTKNTVKVALDELESVGLITKIQESNEYGCQPNQFKLAIEKPLDEHYSSYENNHTPDQNLGGGWSNIDPPSPQNLTQGVGQKMTTQNKDNTKERPTKNTYAPPAGDASTCHAVKSKPKKTERAANVETTDQEHAKLVDKYGPAVVEQCYQELSLWKESASRAQVMKHSSDFLRITKWVALSVIDQSQKEKKLMSNPASTKNPQIEKNRDHALNKLSGVDPSIARCLEHYVEIRIQGKAHQLFYDAHGFEWQLSNALEKACPYPQNPTKGTS